MFLSSSSPARASRIRERKDPKMPGLISDQYDDLTGAVQQVRAISMFPSVVQCKVIAKSRSRRWKAVLVMMQAAASKRGFEEGGKPI